MNQIKPGYIYTQRPDKNDKTLVRHVCLLEKGDFVGLSLL